MDAYRTVLDSAKIVCACFRRRTRCRHRWHGLAMRLQLLTWSVISCCWSMLPALLLLLLPPLIPLHVV